MGLTSPLEADEVYDLVDWLELSAILSADCVARLDLIADAFDIGQETENEDIGHEDAKSESIANDLAGEILRRKQALGDDVYPFDISPNGEILKAKNVENYGQSTYLASLVINHSWSSGKLEAPARLTHNEQRTGRIIFEVLSAVAAVGYARGPAFLIGTNRGGANALLGRVQTICEIAGEGHARPAPLEEAPPMVNDDGVDIIAISKEADGPPARSFVFGQSAAGADWVQKSIRIEVENFLATWFDRQPANCEAVIFIPAAPSVLVKTRQSRRLGHILDRLRLPRYAEQGATMIRETDDLLYFVDDFETPINWLNDYFHRIRA